MFDDAHRRDHALRLLRHGLNEERAGHLVRSPLHLLTGAAAEDMVDPATDEDLRSRGTAYVTGLIEDLVRHGLVASAAPILSAHGAWIGFRLADKGRAEAEHPTILVPPLRVPMDLVTPSIAESLEAIAAEAERTAAVAAWCATIMLYGRWVETLCLGIAIKHGVIDARERVGMNAILNRLRTRGLLADDDVVEHSLELLNAYRNLAVHPRGWTATADELQEELELRLPTESDAHTMRDLVRSVVQRLTAA